MQYKIYFIYFIVALHDSIGSSKFLGVSSNYNRLIFTSLTLVG